MTDTPYEDTDQRLGGHDAQDFALPLVLEGPDGAGLYPWMDYAPQRFGDPREGNDAYETAMALKYPLRDDFEPLQDWED